MSKIKFYLEKNKLYIVLGMISILILGILFFIMFRKEESLIQEEIVIEEKKEARIEIETIKVDVKGYVELEGVYELNSGDRVIDAINKAGGFKEGANTEYINLSKKIVDEMVIVVYSNDEVSKFKEEDKQIIYIEYECICPDNINDSCITEDDVVNTNGIVSEEPKEENININEDKTIEKNNLISINEATKEELMELPGIGESKANNIIKYREENGEFKDIEEIKNISGIGDSVYSKIKDFIKL